MCACDYPKLQDEHNVQSLHVGRCLYILSAPLTADDQILLIVCFTNYDIDNQVQQHITADTEYRLQMCMQYIMYKIIANIFANTTFFFFFNILNTVPTYKITVHSKIQYDTIHTECKIPNSQFQGKSYIKRIFQYP